MSKKTQKITGKQRKAQIQAQTVLFNKIPYSHIYKEMGMIETVSRTFSMGYVIEDVSEENVKQYSNDLIMRRFAMLLNELPEDMSIQFVIHNRLIAQDIFLKKVLVVPDKEEKINPWIEKYNDMVTDNCEIGTSILSFPLMRTLQMRHMLSFSQKKSISKRSFRRSAISMSVL